MVNGIPYLFKRYDKMSYGAEPVVLFSSSADIIFSECASIKSDFEHLKEQFSKDCNLFVSTDDIKLIGKQLSKTEKALKKLDIRIQNTKLLMIS